MATLDDMMNYLGTDTGWKTDLTDKYTYLNYQQYRVKAGICYYNVQTAGGSAPNIPATTWTLLGVLPEGARPSVTIFGAVTSRASSKDMGECQITDDGKVRIYLAAATQIVAFSIAFPVG